MVIHKNNALDVNNVKIGFYKPKINFCFISIFLQETFINQLHGYFN